MRIRRSARPAPPAGRARSPWRPTAPPAPACRRPGCATAPARRSSSRSTGAGRISTITVALASAIQPDRRIGDADGDDVADALAAAGDVTGSVVASASCRTRLSGPDDLDRRRLGRLPPDDEPGRRLAVDDRHDGHDPGRRLLELERHRRRQRPARPRRRTARGPRRCAGGTAASPGAPAARSSTATTSPGSSRPSTRRRAAQPHVDGRRAGRRRSRAAAECCGTRAARACCARRRARRRRSARAASPARWPAPSGRDGGRGGTPSARRRRSPTCAPAGPPLHDQRPQPVAQLVGASARARSGRRAPAQICPVSSDTTIAAASLSSVSPIAARCRVPSSRLTRGLTVSGRKQAAAATRSSWRMTAPSCSGEPGWKIVTSRS